MKEQPESGATYGLPAVRTQTHAALIVAIDASRAIGLPTSAPSASSFIAAV